MSFNESGINRDTGGRFAEKLGTAPDFSLDEPPLGPTDFSNGQYVIYTYDSGKTVAGRVIHSDYYEAEENRIYTIALDDGNTWSGVYGEDLSNDTSRDSTESIARAARFDSAYGVSRTLPDGKVSRSERMHLAAIEAGINEGMNEEWRNQAMRAFDRFAAEDTASGSEEVGTRELLDDSFDDQLRALERVGIMDDEKNEQEIARRTALALLYRDRIDDSSDNWTQDHYDHLTRAWREAIGPVHPDDEERPASWDTTQHTAMSPARKFEGFSDRELEGLRANAWREYREAPDGLKLHAARVIDAAADSRGLQ